MEASHGEEALTSVEAHPPDVVLMNVLMPRMDGIEACRRLRADPTTAQIPVILVTSQRRREVRLDRQFRALNTIGDIDRAILLALDADRITDAVLEGTRDLLSCDRIVVCRLDWLGAQEGRLTIDPPPAGSSASGEKVTLSGGEVRDLSSARRSFPVADPVRIEHLMGMEAGEARQAMALVAPLILSDGLAGYFAISRSGPEGVSTSASDHFDRVAEQLSVGCSSARLLEEMDRMSWGALTALARAIDAKSPWTLGHSERVAALSVALGRGMGLPEDRITNLQRGGLVHDLGKIGVPSEILDGGRPLTPEERELIQTHPEAGVRILEPTPAMEGIIPIVFYHHESWDESGDPMGLPRGGNPPGSQGSGGCRPVRCHDLRQAVSSRREHGSRGRVDRGPGGEGAGPHLPRRCFSSSWVRESSRSGRGLPASGSEVGGHPHPATCRHA